MSLLSARRKTVLVALFIFAVIAMMATLQYRAVDDHRSVEELRVLVSDIQSNVLTLRRNEKDFLARKDLEYRQRFGKNYQRIQANIQALRSGLQKQDVENTRTDQLIEILDTYKTKFLAMADLQEEIGLNYQDGTYGRLWTAIRQVEDMLQLLRHDQLIKDMLMLRREEKDFMLRKDIEYVEKFDADMVVMQSDLANAYLDPRIKQQIAAALTAYERHFKVLVAATHRMGFNSNHGLHGEMRKTIHEGEAVLEELRKDVLGLESSTGNRMLVQIIASAVVLTIFMGVLIRL